MDRRTGLPNNARVPHSETDDVPPPRVDQRAERRDDDLRPLHVGGAQVLVRTSQRAARPGDLARSVVRHAAPRRFPRGGPPAAHRRARLELLRLESRGAAPHRPTGQGAQPGLPGRDGRTGAGPQGSDVPREAPGRRRDRRAGRRGSLPGHPRGSRARRRGRAALHPGAVPARRRRRDGADAARREADRLRPQPLPRPAHAPAPPARGPRPQRPRGGARDQPRLPVPLQLLRLGLGDQLEGPPLRARPGLRRPRRDRAARRGLRGGRGRQLRDVPSRCRRRRTDLRDPQGSRSPALRVLQRVEEPRRPQRRDRAHPASGERPAPALPRDPAHRGRGARRRGAREHLADRPDARRQGAGAERCPADGAADPGAAGRYAGALADLPDQADGVGHPCGAADLPVRAAPQRAGRAAGVRAEVGARDPGRPVPDHGRPLSAGGERRPPAFPHADRHTELLAGGLDRAQCPQRGLRGAALLRPDPAHRALPAPQPRHRLPGLLPAAARGLPAREPVAAGARRPGPGAGAELPGRGRGVRPDQSGGCAGLPLPRHPDPVVFHPARGAPRGLLRCAGHLPARALPRDRAAAPARRLPAADVDRAGLRRHAGQELPRRGRLARLLRRHLGSVRP